VHAEHLQHRVVGDKIYGPDETLYIEFIEKGWTERLAATLPIKRQGLHCYRYDFEFQEGTVSFTAPLQADILDFCLEYMGLSSDEINNLCYKECS
jgi:23S rRNA pseudouridine1911/1915/1917 synthase